jgi:hypothetical protein
VQITFNWQPAFNFHFNSFWPDLALATCDSIGGEDCKRYTVLTLSLNKS